MIKKLVSSGSLLLASFSFAGTVGTAQPVEAYNGFYVGGALGISSLLNKQETTSPTEVHELGNLGIAGGGLIGYDYTISNQFKVGVEGYIYGYGAKASIYHNQDATTFSFKHKYNLGVRVIPGFEFVPGTVGGVILGYTNGKFNIYDEPNSNAAVTHGAYGLLTARNFTKNAFQVGLTMKTMVIGNLSVRLDALYTNYGTYSATGYVKNGNGIGAFNDLYKNPLRSLESEIILSYKFANV